MDWWKLRKHISEKRKKNVIYNNFLYHALGARWKEPRQVPNNVVCCVSQQWKYSIHAFFVSPSIMQCCVDFHTDHVVLVNRSFVDQIGSSPRWSQLIHFTSSLLAPQPTQLIIFKLFSRLICALCARDLSSCRLSTVISATNEPRTEQRAQSRGCVTNANIRKLFWIANKKLTIQNDEYRWIRHSYGKNQKSIYNLTKVT